MPINAPEIAVIGGGTGSFTLLQELKEFTPNITAIPSMADDGSSTGILRDEMGVLPMGDVRQCLVALSNWSEARDMFTYRARSGPNKGHPLGNTILSQEQERHGGDLEKAIEIVGQILRITGQVAPISLQDHRLLLRDGEQTIHGESALENYAIRHRDATVALAPNVTINPRAAEAIMQAEMVVLAPGNLYRSLLPALAVEGLREVFKESDAKKVLIANLINKPGQTDGWHVVDYVKQIGRYIGESQIECVLYNSQPPADDLLARYAEDGEYTVDTAPGRFLETQARAIGAHLLSRHIYVPDAQDTMVRRTLIRHDAHQVGRMLMRLHYE